MTNAEINAFLQTLDAKTVEQLKKFIDDETATPESGLVRLYNEAMYGRDVKDDILKFVLALREYFDKVNVAAAGSADRAEAAAEAVADVSESDYVPVTDGLVLRNSGVTVQKIGKNKIKIFGTAEYGIVFNVMNGAADYKKQTSEATKSIPAGHYVFNKTITGYLPEEEGGNIYFYSSTTNFTPAERTIIANGAELNFTETTAIAFICDAGVNYGTETNPTEIVVELVRGLTAVDTVARERADEVETTMRAEQEATAVKLDSEIKSVENDKINRNFAELLTQDGAIGTDGEEKSTQTWIDNYCRSDYIKVYKGQKVSVNVMHGATLVCILAVYDSDKSFIDEKSVTGNGASNVKRTFAEIEEDGYIRICTAKGYEEMADVRIYFGDKDIPVYVAFGASTTVGAVHTYTDADDDAVVYTPTDYPTIVGNALNVHSYNRGYGGTGFVARNSQSNPHPNICDAIINSAEILETADVITIIFGYGNDTIAPLGYYDDYFDYDKTSYREGYPGVADIVNAGATIFGCLNWCIKHLQDNYPKAQLLILYSSPAINSGRRVEIENNTVIFEEFNAEETYKTGDGVRHEGDNFICKKSVMTAGPWNPENWFEYKTPKKLRFKEKGDEGTFISREFAKLKSELNISMYDMSEEGSPFSWYATQSKDESGHYKVFSTIKKYNEQTGAKELSFNTHPNEDGYKVYARFIAGKVLSHFKH